MNTKHRHTKLNIVFSKWALWLVQNGLNLAKKSKESTVDGYKNVNKSKEEAMNCRSYKGWRDVQRIELWHSQVC